MRRRSFTRLFSFWTARRTRRPAAGAPTWSDIPIRLSMSAAGPGPVRFTPEQLDVLWESIAPEIDGDRTDHSPLDPEGFTSSSGEQDLFLHTVDRAIAEIAGPRGRRRRAHR